MYNNPGNDIVIPKKLLDEGLNIGDNDYKQTSWNNELMNLLDALDALQIFNNDDFDILNVQFDNIKLNHEMIDKLSASIIVSATMYNKLNTDAIVIPHIALDSRREYILDTELKALLINLVDNKILFGCAENEEVDLLKITKPNINNITTDVIRNFAKSDILEATMINIITHKGDETNEGNVGSAVNIPQAYDDDSTRKALEEKKTKNIWFVNDEMIKLADALDALDIHNLKIKDPSTITDKFKYDYMHSAFAKDNTKTNLHVVMSSAIISSTISKTIIDTLKPEMIYDDIKTHRSIYNSSKTVESYTETEIENLLFGLKKLGIDDLSSINQNEVYDRIKNSAKDIDNTLIDDIWNSRLLAGVVTTQIRNKEDVEGSIIHHHDKAYEKDINIYRSIEIKTLLKLLGNSDVENIELKNILLRNIKNSIQNSEGKVDSYILLKTISDNLYKNEASNGIIIPNKCFNREQGYINPDELANLINGLEILGYENCDISLLEIGTTKSQEQYKEAFNSIIIRATVTSLIDIRSEKGKQYSTAIYNSHIEIDRDCRNVSKKIAIINSDELLNIVKSFKALIGNNNTSLSYTFNIEQLAMMDKEVLDDILSSDLFHIYVSDNLIELYKKLPQATEPTDENFVDVVYLLTLIEKSNHEILTVNQIVEILNFKKILV